MAWYFMSRWLESFAYRMEIQLWIFVLAGLIALVIAIITISYKSVRSALMNPVTSLRSD
jgi:putative ABC transport system permease protein